MSETETEKIDNTAPRLPSEIRQMLKSLKDEIMQIDGVESVVLFGSYSKGTHTPDSDIDIAVFIRNNAADRIGSVFRQAVRRAAHYKHDIQIVIFTSDMLDEPAGIVEEIVTYGRDISEL